MKRIIFILQLKFKKKTAGILLKTCCFLSPLPAQIDVETPEKWQVLLFNIVCGMGEGLSRWSCIRVRRLFKSAKTANLFQDICSVTVASYKYPWSFCWSFSLVKLCSPTSLPLLTCLQKIFIGILSIDNKRWKFFFFYDISESKHFFLLWNLWLTACNCNSFGSYSSQCNYTTGKCHCRPNIRGSHCDRCDEGMVGFPTCVKCDCNPDGSRFLPGLGNNVCYGSSKVNVLLVGNSNQLLNKLSAVARGRNTMLLPY